MCHSFIVPTWLEADLHHFGKKPQWSRYLGQELDKVLKNSANDCAQCKARSKNETVCNTFSHPSLRPQNCLPLLICGIGKQNVYKLALWGTLPTDRNEIIGSHSVVLVYPPMKNFFHGRKEAEVSTFSLSGDPMVKTPEKLTGGEDMTKFLLSITFVSSTLRPANVRNLTMDSKYINNPK